MNLFLSKNSVMFLRNMLCLLSLAEAMFFESTPDEIWKSFWMAVELLKIVLRWVALGKIKELWDNGACMFLNILVSVR